MNTPTAQATFARLTRRETMLALPRAVPVAAPVVRSGLTTREALEAIVLDALTSTPCYILFSGGRDSSALLALALHLARLHGLPEPVPVTYRHPESPESDETRWQELVIDHLRPREHVVLEFRGEQRLLGESATTALRRHGPVWPEAVQLQGAIYRHLDPGTMISGEGGDMVLTGHRMGDLRDALTLTRPRRAHIRSGLEAARPSALRRRDAAARAHSMIPSWSRPPAVAEYVREVVAMNVEPLRWNTATRAVVQSRQLAVFIANVEAGMSEFDLQPVTPFVDPRFIDAFAREAGPFGWGNRTAVFRRLFHDLLPDRALSRTSKASFNSTRWGPAEREFARAWDGTGLDPELIDPDELRVAWLQDDPHPAADFLLHVAWAHAHAIPLALEDAP